MVGWPQHTKALWVAHSGSPAVMGSKPFRPLTLRSALSCGLPFTDELLFHCGIEPFDTVREDAKNNSCKYFRTASAQAE